MENLSSFMKNGNKSKLDYSSAVKNKEQICKILQIESSCTHTQFKNAIRYKFVAALPEIAKNAEAVKIAKKVLNLCDFNVDSFKRWLSSEQITEIKKTVK